MTGHPDRLAWRRSMAHPEDAGGVPPDRLGLSSARDRIQPLEAAAALT